VFCGAHRVGWLTLWIPEFQWLVYIPPGLVLKNSTLCPMQCVYVFCMDLKTGDGYLPVHGVCLLCSTSSAFIYNARSCLSLSIWILLLRCLRCQLFWHIIYCSSGRPILTSCQAKVGIVSMPVIGHGFLFPQYSQFIVHLSFWYSCRMNEMYGK
jgi:hypothetical protein